MAHRDFQIVSAIAFTVTSAVAERGDREEGREGTEEAAQARRSQGGPACTGDTLSGVTRVLPMEENLRRLEWNRGRSDIWAHLRLFALQSVNYFLLARIQRHYFHDSWETAFHKTCPRNRYGHYPHQSRSRKP